MKTNKFLSLVRVFRMVGVFTTVVMSVFLLPIGNKDSAHSKESLTVFDGVSRAHADTPHDSGGSSGSSGSCVGCASTTGPSSSDSASGASASSGTGCGLY